MEKHHKVCHSIHRDQKGGTAEGTAEGTSKSSPATRFYSFYLNKLI